MRFEPRAKRKITRKDEGLELWQRGLWIDLGFKWWFIPYHPGTWTQCA